MKIFTHSRQVLIFLLLISLSITSLTAHARSAAQDTPETPQEIVFSLLKDGNGKMLYFMCDSQVQQAVDIGSLNSLWKNMEAQAGKYVSHGQWQDFPGLEGAVYSNISFENEKMALLIVFNEDGMVSGLRILPPLEDNDEDEAGRNADTAAVRNDAEENDEKSTTQKNMEDTAADWNVTECAVQTKSWTLPALLTGPDSERERTPIVILVHGSGPNNKDESIGPNKVFKELAEELAAYGIASLRYDKRTLIYGHGAFSNPEKVTLAEETIDDAVSAAALAGSMGFRHIFILGHSLGAACAPLIALQCSTSGIIMMAAPARPMKEMLEEQTKVISPYNSQETMEQLRKATETIPADYLKEVDYDRMQVAQEIAGKDIPTLILQGERDYQVTMEDFGIWKEAFSTACGPEIKKTAEEAAEKATGTDGSDVTGKECVIDSDIIMKSYPGLNHIFHKGEGVPSPAEYMQKGRIPEQVIRDIAGFIHSMSKRHPAATL